VRDRSEDGLTHAPKQVLDRHGQPECRPVPTPVLEHRELEEAHGRAWPEVGGRDHAAAYHDQPGERRCSGSCGSGLGHDNVLTLEAATYRKASFIQMNCRCELFNNFDVSYARRWLRRQEHDGTARLLR